jgi:hypothetical protein
MIRIKQTIHTPTDGNCLAASLASILENNIEDYPTLPNSGQWYQVLQSFLHSLGYNLVLIEGPHESVLTGYHLIIGYNESSGHMHCVVGKDGKVVHDPSPVRDENSKPLEDPYYGIISKLFL